MDSQNEAIQDNSSVPVMPKKRCLKCYSVLSLITVEPIFFISAFTFVMYSTISKQYIFNYFSEYYHLKNSSQRNECSLHNYTNTTIPLEAQVSATSQVSAAISNWVLYLNIAGFIPGFFSAVLMGAWGDVVGRKPPLFCSLFGLFTLTIIYIIVIELNLHVYYLLAARLLSGLCGDFGVILLSCYSYFGDISTLNGRTYRVAIGEASSGLGGVIASLASGVWIDSQGFGPPLYMVAASMLCALLYVMFLLPESYCFEASPSLCQRIRILFACKRFTGIWTMLSRNWGKCWKILGMVFCYFLSSATFAGIFSSIIVYELNPPLCWSSTLVGYGTALISGQFISGMMTIKVLKGRLSDVRLVLLGATSTAISLLIYGFSSVTWMMFLGYGVAAFATIGVTVIRSTVSKLATPPEQGVAFALLGCSDSIANLAGSLMFNGIYSMTVDTSPGMIFFLGAGIQPLFFLLFWLIYMKTRVDLDASRMEEYYKFIDSCQPQEE